MILCTGRFIGARIHTDGHLLTVAAGVFPASRRQHQVGTVMSKALEFHDVPISSTIRQPRPSGIGRLGQPMRQHRKREVQRAVCKIVNKLMQSGQTPPHAPPG
jgi:hypothetical protein